MTRIFQVIQIWAGWNVSQKEQFAENIAFWFSFDEISKIEAHGKFATIQIIGSNVEENIALEGCKINM